MLFVRFDELLQIGNAQIAMHFKHCMHERASKKSLSRQVSFSFKSSPHIMLINISDQSLLLLKCTTMTTAKREKTTTRLRSSL